MGAELRRLRASVVVDLAVSDERECDTGDGFLFRPVWLTLTYERECDPATGAAVGRWRCTTAHAYGYPRHPRPGEGARFRTWRAVDRPCTPRWVDEEAVRYLPDPEEA